MGSPFGGPEPGTKARVLSDCYCHDLVVALDVEGMSQVSDKNEKVSLGELLKIWRTRSGMSVHRVAVVASEIIPGRKTISHATVQRYEAEQFRKSGIDATILKAITEALGHDVTDLPREEQNLIKEWGVSFWLTA
jgi:hypothetical protein